MAKGFENQQGMFGGMADCFNSFHKHHRDLSEALSGTLEQNRIAQKLILNSSLQQAAQQAQKSLNPLGDADVSIKSALGSMGLATKASTSMSPILDLILKNIKPVSESLARLTDSSVALTQATKMIWSFGESELFRSGIAAPLGSGLPELPSAVEYFGSLESSAIEESRKSAFSPFRGVQHLLGSLNNDVINGLREQQEDLRSRIWKTLGNNGVIGAWREQEEYKRQMLGSLNNDVINGLREQQENLRSRIWKILGNNGVIGAWREQEEYKRQMLGSLETVGIHDKIQALGSFSEARSLGSVSAFQEFIINKKAVLNSNLIPLINTDLFSGLTVKSISTSSLVMPTVRLRTPTANDTYLESDFTPLKSNEDRKFTPEFLLYQRQIPIPEAVESPDPDACFGPVFWCLLTNIEQHLRVTIEKNLTELSGSNWIRQRVPYDIRERWKQRQEEDRRKDRPVYGLIYYADFMDLASIIIRRDNWKEMFKSIFKSENEINISLKRLHPIRKSIAHSRPLSKDDILTLASEANQILSALGVPFSLELGPIHFHLH